MSQYKKPKDFWGNSENAKEWIRRVDLKLANKGSTTFKSIDAFVEDVNENKDKFNSFLEVGAGNGRLIGALSEKFLDKECYSIDINPALSDYVHEKYPNVTTFIGEVAKLPLEDNSYDLVYTYQVLQHVVPEEMEMALKELVRVAKKEIWLMEGYDPECYQFGNGIMRTNADGGTFAWFFDEMLKCYAHDFVEGIRVYKIKKDDPWLK